MKSDKQLVMHGLVWKYLERSAAQAVQFVVTLLLARLLLPEDFGALSLVTVFLNIALVFVQSGFGTALVQKESVTEEEFNSVFYFSLTLGALLAGLFFFLAPLISDFFAYPVLKNVLRVLALSLPLAGMNNVLQARVIRRMQFKKLFAASVTGSLFSAAVSLFMAFRGFGIWALVVQQLMFQIVSFLVLSAVEHWRAGRSVSFASIRGVLSFGSKLLLSNLIDCIYTNLYTLVIGKCFSSEAVGYYDKGRQFPGFVITNVNAAVQSVMFPALARKQSDVPAVKGMVRRLIAVSTFIIFPCMAGLFVAAEPLIRLLLTEKWLPAVPFLRAYCLIYALWPVFTANLQAINALGRSDIFLILEIIKKGVGVLILLFTLPMGLKAMIAGSCVSAFLGIFINSFPNRKLLGYRTGELFRDLAPAAAMSAAMGAAAYFAGCLVRHDLMKLLVEAACGVFVYIFLAKLFHSESYRYILMSVRQFRTSSGTADQNAEE